MEQDQCCLAIFTNSNEANAASCHLRAAGVDQALFSLVQKPIDTDNMALFIRLPRVGIVICEGPFSQVLQRRERHTVFNRERRAFEAIPDGRLTGLAAALYEIGVPENWLRAYENALLHNRILLVAYGPETRMRKLCRLLAETSAHEPVLYLR